MTRRLFCCLAGLLLCSAGIFAQEWIKNPYVESGYQSQYGSFTIQGVLCGDSSTLVILEDITARGYSGLTISMSSNTVLTYGNRSARIVSWGYWDGEEIQEKEFNTGYSIKADRRYRFVLKFPAVPQGVSKVSIVENEQGGFYWYGIRLDGTQGGSSSGSSSGGFSNYSGKSGSSIDWSDAFDPVASGTCFAINQDGYLATCYHVVDGATKIRIRGIGGNFDKLYKARIVRVDKTNDLAIIKIEDPSFTGLAPIPYAIQNRHAEVGEDVFVLGYPLRAYMGDEIKLTSGLISARTGYQGDKTAYQISATVQSGNSGGPLLDKNGNVIGVVNARLAVESAAYAVKNMYLKQLTDACGITISQNSTLGGNKLADQVKSIRKFIFIIEVE